MIQYNKKALTNSLLLLAIIVGALVIGCGRMPPEPYWTMSTEDSTTIQGIVNVWRDTFTTKFEDDFCNVAGHSNADTLKKFLLADMRSIWMRPHYWPRTFKRQVTDYTMVDSFISVKDTTVTVTLNENFHGMVVIKADSCTMRDTLRLDTVIGTDTLPLYSRFFYYQPDTVVENSFDGYGSRSLHFDKKDGSWKLKKISGGLRIFVPNENDAPYLSLCSLRTRVKSVGIQLRPDTIRYGIQRMYNMDSIMSFPPTDTFTMRVMNYDPIIDFSFLHYKGQRYDLSSIPTAFLGTFPITLSSRWNNIMVELAPWQGLTERGNYNAIFWSLPVRIVP